jgi:hypothetical protein
VFAQYLKGLVELKIDMAWYKHRSDLAAGENQTLKGQFAPQGAAGKGMELLTGRKSLSPVLLKLLFQSPPTCPQSILSSWLTQIFTPQTLPVCPSE